MSKPQRERRLGCLFQQFVGTLDMLLFSVQAANHKADTASNLWENGFSDGKVVLVLLKHSLVVGII